MGTIRLTELGSEPTMAVKLVAVLSVLSSVAAEASLGYYGPGIAHHGYGATSYVARSPQGAYGHGFHHLGKRSAEPGYGYYHGGYSHQHVSRPYSHYGVSVNHGIGKRSAEPSHYYSGAHSFAHESRPHFFLWLWCEPPWKAIC